MLGQEDGRAWLTNEPILLMKSMLESLSLLACMRPRLTRLAKFIRGRPADKPGRHEHLKWAFD